MKYRNKYLIKEVPAGDTIEFFKTQSSRYGYNLPRSENTGSTPRAVERNNQRMAEDALRQLLNENFVDGDLHVVFKYFLLYRPKTPEEAQKDFAMWVRRMRPKLQKLKIEMKYVYAVGIGERGAVHIHVVLNSMDIGYIRECWSKGSIYYTQLYTDGQYRELANYIIKQTIGMRENGWSGRRYTPSKNLRRPKPKKKQVSAKTWRQEPKPPQGYMFDPTFPLENGVCEVTGLTYQRYGVIRIKPPNERYPNRRCNE